MYFITLIVILGKLQACLLLVDCVVGVESDLRGRGPSPLWRGVRNGVHRDPFSLLPLPLRGPISQANFRNLNSLAFFSQNLPFVRTACELVSPYFFSDSKTIPNSYEILIATIKQTNTFTKISVM